MSDWTASPPRYWSPRQKYATGDVLLGLIAQGWHISAMQPAHIEGPARLHLVTLQRGGDSLSLPVLDGPAVQAFVRTVPPDHSHLDIAGG